MAYIALIQSCFSFARSYPVGMVSRLILTKLLLPQTSGSHQESAFRRSLRRYHSQSHKQWLQTRALKAQKKAKLDDEIHHVRVGRAEH